ncbi:hypothetical protein ABZ802_30100 [Streptomyces sp. NPDC047737]|uniref:hypothetical protein n=1 Tax=Streptomyces sp. NPDC047737 TaxID=3155740 RepID=UPI0033D1D240
MVAEKTAPNTRSAPSGTVSLSTVAAERRSRRSAGRGGAASTAGRASRPAPHPLSDDGVARVPRAPDPAFADLPELPTLPMLLGFGFWVPGAEKPAPADEGTGSGPHGRAPSPARQGEGRPLPGASSST